MLHLHSLYRLLKEMLENQQRIPWFDEEIKGLFTLVDQRKNSDDYYLRIKGAWRLDNDSLLRLRHLCQWRENIARTKDVPRSRIAKDSVLLEIIKQMPAARQSIACYRRLASR